MERSWETVADSRLCRRQMCGICLNTTGSRTRGYSPFRASRPSDALTFRNKDNQKRRLEDVNMNRRGISSLRFYNVRISMASERREVK